MPTLTVLHTNDLHGRFEALTRIATLIQRERAQAHGEGRALLVLDAGDSSSSQVWQSEVTEGRANYVLLEAIGYDAAVIGNADLGWGAAALNRLVTSIHFPALAANLKGAAKTSEVLKTAEVYVGVLGLTTHKNAHADFQFDDPLATAQRLIPQLKGQGGQVIIVLSHLGLEVDRQLAAAVPGIDLIVGGHTHTTLSQADVIGRTAVVQTGAFGSNLGRVDLKVNFESGEVELLDSQLIPVTTKIPPDPTVSGMLELIQFEAETLKKRRVAK
jgi:2',3'-cyclic-nucleotide 2'-phosphodiesterase (5'-nucleotidase family)